MGEGSLPGIEPPAPRRRGRPKGSTNKRAKDLQGFIAAKYGASAAQQSAAVCMVTPAELRQAGGSMAKAQVNKALDLVGHVRSAQAGLDEALRQVVREELAELVAGMEGAKARDLQRLVTGFLGRVREAQPFGLAQAMKLITDERAALLPYTDKRQPLAIEAEGDGFRPHVVVLGGAGQAVGEAMAALPEGDTEIIGEFVDVTPQVSRPKSHDEQQSLALQGFEPPEPTD